MDITIATAIRFKISHSTIDTDHTRQAPTVHTRTVSKPTRLKKIQNKKDLGVKGSYFTETPSPKINLNLTHEEEVVGTLWLLECQIAGNGIWTLIHDKLTTKELKAFILIDTTDRTDDIVAIDVTLALANTHADKFSYNTDITHTIPTLMKCIAHSTVLDGSGLHKVATEYSVKYTDQVTDSAAHTAREAFIALVTGSGESSIAWRASAGIYEQ